MADVNLGTNTASFTGSNIGDSSQSNIDTVVVLDNADLTLGVTVTPSATRIVKGKTLTYTIVITNANTNTQTAQKVKITDHYDPSYFTNVTVTSDKSTATFSTPSGGSFTGDLGDIDVGASVTVTVSGIVSTS